MDRVNAQENNLMGVREKWKRFRKLPEDISQRVDKLVPVFQGHGIQLAYLFGSFEVISWGRIIFKTSDDVENRFELRTLTAYQDREPVRRRQNEILAERTGQWSSKSG